MKYAHSSYAHITIKMSLAHWVKFKPQFYPQILHQCTIYFLWTKPIKPSQIHDKDNICITKLTNWTCENCSIVKTIPCLLTLTQTIETSILSNKVNKINKGQLLSPNSIQIFKIFMSYNWRTFTSVFLSGPSSHIFLTLFVVLWMSI